MDRQEMENVYLPVSYPLSTRWKKSVRFFPIF